MASRYRSGRVVCRVRARSCGLFRWTRHRSPCWLSGTKGSGICLPHHVSDTPGRVPRNQGDFGKWRTHLTCADDVTPVANWARLQYIHQHVVDACNRWGRSLRDDRLTLWSNFSGRALRLEQIPFEPQASMVLFGAWWMWAERFSAVRHRAAAAKRRCCKIISFRVRTQRLGSDVLAVFV